MPQTSRGDPSLHPQGGHDRVALGVVPVGRGVPLGDTGTRPRGRRERRPHLTEGDALGGGGRGALLGEEGPAPGGNHAAKLVKDPATGSSSSGRGRCG